MGVPVLEEQQAGEGGCDSTRQRERVGDSSFVEAVRGGRAAQGSGGGRGAELRDPRRVTEEQRELMEFDRRLKEGRRREGKGEEEPRD